MALIFIQPTFTINDMDMYVTIVPLMEKVIKERAETLGLRAGLTGILVVGKDEMVTSEQGLALSMLIAASLILLLLILSFSMYSVPFISGIPLFVGILWTVGLAGFVIRRLNILTAMYMVALLGLGIDYAIHLLTSFVQEREEGKAFVGAVGNSLKNSGAGILTGALTTAIAFFMLVIARSEVVREFGVVAGFGILSEFLAMVILVAALMGFRNYRLSKKGKAESKLLKKLTPMFRIIPSLGAKIKNYPALFVLMMLVVGILSATQAGKVEIEGNLMNILTGRNEEGEKVAETVIDRLTELMEENPESIEGLIEFQKTLVPLLKEKLINMANTEEITLEMIPDHIRDSFRSKDGKDYLMNVIPTQNPWNEEYRTVLTNQLETITDKATGMILAADQMTEIAKDDGIKAAAAALIAIFILLIIDFRNIKLSIVTLLPPLLSFASLFGIMALARIKFDFVNIIAVPLLIGIGIDDVVHFNHRYLLEGKGNMDRVVAKTGRAVLLTTLTTIIGFGSFIPSIMRAMRSTGIVLSIAMALAFLYSILLHPAVLIILKERLGLNIKPWNFKRRKK